MVLRFIYTTKGTYFDLATGALASQNFAVDSNGNAFFKGEITATSGKIGGFYIDGNAITDIKGSGFGTNSSAVYLSPSGISLGTKFKVDYYGNITATSGTIGGFTITDNSIYKSSNSVGASGGIYLGDNGFSISDALVYKSGELTVKGTIYANKGVIGGWTITDGKIYGGDGSTNAPVAVMQRPQDGMSWVFACGGTSHSAYTDCVFKVSKTGRLYCKDIVVNDTYSIYTSDKGIVKIINAVAGSETKSSNSIDIGVNGKVISFPTSGNGIDIYPAGTLRIQLYKNGDLSVNQGNINLDSYYTIWKGSNDLSACVCYSNTKVLESFTDNGNYGIRPAVGSTYPLGSPSYQWKAVYGVNVFKNGTTVSTSDSRLKEMVNDIDSRLEEIFMDFRFVSYMRKNVNENDNHDRLHIGGIAQDFKKVIESHGLSSDSLALVCHDYYNEEVDGLYEKWGLNYEEISQLAAHMTQKAIRETVELKKEVNELKKEIEMLKNKVQTE